MNDNLGQIGPQYQFPSQYLRHQLGHFVLYREILSTIFEVIFSKYAEKGPPLLYHKRSSKRVTAEQLLLWDIQEITVAIWSSLMAMTRIPQFEPNSQVLI
jgi:hypothetical protein